MTCNCFECKKRRRRREQKFERKSQCPRSCMVPAPRRSKEESEEYNEQ